MAKNQSKKKPATAQSKPNATEAAKTAESAKATESKPAKASLYQIKTARTSGIIKAYITFTYRILHPGVTPRLILYGLLVAAPGVFFFKDVFWKVFFIATGAAMILLGFFRQYISLAMTKKNDPDYKSGAEFTYDFYESSASFFKADERFSGIAKYKDITGFFYDEGYYYLGVGKEVHILPKDAFTIGEPADFEEFIYKKSKVICRWIPNKLSDRIKKRRAERAVASREPK